MIPVGGCFCSPLPMVAVALVTVEAARLPVKDRSWCTEGRGRWGGVKGAERGKGRHVGTDRSDLNTILTSSFSSLKISLLSLSLSLSLYRPILSCASIESRFSKDNLRSFFSFFSCD